MSPHRELQTASDRDRGLRGRDLSVQPVQGLRDVQAVREQPSLRGVRQVPQSGEPSPIPAMALAFGAGAAAILILEWFFL